MSFINTFKFKENKKKQSVQPFYIFKYFFNLTGITTCSKHWDSRKKREKAVAEKEKGKEKDRY